MTSECYNCNETNSDDAKKCRSCGVALQMPIKTVVCPQCGENVDYVARCDKCGGDLEKKIAR